MKRRFLALMAVLAVMLWTACTKDSTGSNPTTGQITLKVAYEAPTLLSSQASATASEVDSIRITRARFLIRNIRFKSTVEDSLDFRSDPLVVELNLNGVENTIGVSEVPFGTYRRLDFRVHRLDPNDPEDRPFVGLPEFADFMQNERYSMIIEGQVFGTMGNGMDFTFRSRANEKQRHELIPPLLVDESHPEVTVTLIVDASNWFRDGNGGLLDPTDPQNEDEITQNLKNSIRPR